MQENVEEMPGAMMLVGNKVDLEESSEREVSTETGETFAKVSCMERESIASYRALTANS